MHGLSPFPILSIPGWMSQSGLICSALITLDSRGQEDTVTHSVLQGSSALGVGGIWNAHVCFSTSQRGQGYASELKHQNQFANP